MQRIWLIFLFSLTLLNCRQAVEKRSGKDVFDKGTFGYDFQFLHDHHETLLLKSEDSKALVAVSPEWQGRVMTSSFNGMEGISMGWINHELIKSGEIKPQMNAFGGEDRFWLGPEGGQFSLYFKQGADFVFPEWQVPAEIDTEPFDLVEATSLEARFKREMELTNHSGFKFNLLVERDIRLLKNNDVMEILGINIEEMDFVAYKSVNRISNTGEKAWTRDTGALSIWILGMYQPSDNTTVVIPFKKGDEKDLGPKVNDSYFGKIPPERLIVKDDVLFFSGDGKHRGKLGIGAQRALPFMGAYNAEANILTIVKFTLPEKISDYVNSMWELQDDPFSGDVVNSYNDGPVEGGDQLGPFFELESSSPAAFLIPGETVEHQHITIHITGNKEKLDQLAVKLFGVRLNEISIERK